MHPGVTRLQRLNASLRRFERTLGLTQCLTETIQLEKYLSCFSFGTPTSTDAARLARVPPLLCGETNDVVVMDNTNIW